MCELLGLSSNLPATVNFSLTVFAEHGGHTDNHTDGWGIAYYEGKDARLLKEPEAAADSTWIRFLNAAFTAQPLGHRASPTRDYRRTFVREYTAIFARTRRTCPCVRAQW
ncbi:MAG: class II glutamine amidotransferase [Gammaproteobacteria bacterium]